MKFKRITGVLIAAVSTVALSACNGAGSGGTQAMGANLTQDNFSQQLTAAQSSAKSLHLSGNITAGGQALSLSGDLATGDQSLKSLQAHLTMKIGSKSLQVILVGGSLYIDGAGMGMTTDPAKPWIKADLTNPNSPLGSVYNQLLDQMDPANMSKAFQAITTFKRVGSESVNGVPATHYLVTVDTAKAVKAMGMTQVGGKSLTQALASMPKTMSYDVWVDGSSRPVEIKTTFSGSKLDLHFTDWGKAVTVKAPPASEVTTMSM